MKPHLVLLGSIASLIISCSRSPSALPAQAPSVANSVPQPQQPAPLGGVRTVAALDQAPGNLTLTPDGVLLVSLHQFFSPPYPVAKVHEDGTLTEYAKAAQLDCVLGLQSDPHGVVWLLDNGMRASHRPRLVGWQHAQNRVVVDLDLSEVTPSGAFVNDLAVDADHQQVYIADPAGGQNAALIVVDLAKKTARRLLEGHPSVLPEPIDLIVDQRPLIVKKDDGTAVRPHVGINPIALDAKNEWLYFGPMHGGSLYRVRTSDLVDQRLTSAQLALQVERYSDKPSCDGIAIDRSGNIYLGDLAENAIGVIRPDRTYYRLAQGEQYSWIDAFAFGPDGQLYTLANQLHRAPALNNGRDQTKAPFMIFALAPLARGIVGR
ncbi:MAG TPA: L-dopachrome tautomerase-related protein [Polyangiaceae bacterium]|nr:L-dopachrome tautomerase-related protein [Polyangiaceae bacterium]